METKKMKKTTNQFNKMTLFLIRLSNGPETFLKIGMTGQSIEERLKTLIRYDIEEVLFEVELPEILGRGVERVINLSCYYSGLKYVPNFKFVGHTQCYVDCSEVIDKVQRTIEKATKMFLAPPTNNDDYNRLNSEFNSLRTQNLLLGRNYHILEKQLAEYKKLDDSLKTECNSLRVENLLLGRNYSILEGQLAEYKKLDEILNKHCHIDPTKYI